MAQFRPKQLAHLDPKSVAQIRPFYPIDFAKFHAPDKTAKIEADHKAVYDKKNARLDERIAGLKAEAKKAAKKTKADTKPVEAAKSAPAKPKGKTVQAAA